MVVSALIGHCEDDAHYPSTVPQVIASAAGLFTLAQPRKYVEWNSELAIDKTRQTGHGSKD